jgi:sugar/nucleoside kinase (ribokinase family)
VDTTGAGDAFAAGYLCGKIRGWPASDAALFANAMGAAASLRMGAGEAMPGTNEVIPMLQHVPEDDASAPLAKRLLNLLLVVDESARA